ncbi:MAG: DUF2865 domain-containing protein [Bosea sp. (in: a-proteobacteria)]
MARNTDPRERSFLMLTEAPRLEAAPSPHQLLRERFRGSASAPEQSSVNGPAVSFRLVALGILGASIGIGGAVLGVSLVQANDRVDMYETTRFDDNVRKARRAAAPQVISTSHSSYAPQRSVVNQPLRSVNDRGLITFPDFNLNPFIPRGADRKSANFRTKPKVATTAQALGEDTLDTVSGAANVPRSICVRLCDGYQHPLGYIRDSADLPGHQALCTAMFPDVPTRVFHVAAGAEGIDDAVGSDGKTYRSLPMAYAYQTSIDPACARPRTGTQSVSLLKDFTLRAGDAVVINGRPRIFSGSSSYPFTAANFRDFRSSNIVSEAARKQLDQAVGVSRRERLQREARQMARVREANAIEPNRAVDLVRGGASSTSGQIRIIDLGKR